MSIKRAAGLGLGLFFAAVAAHAMGCAGDDAGSAEGIASDGEAARFHGCPQNSPMSTASDGPAHALPGPCRGAANPQQARQDGASAEMLAHCRAYCGQTSPQCGQRADLVDLACESHGSSHRWDAICACQ